MKLISFLAQKIVIIEVMLIVLQVALIYFGITFPILTSFLIYFTPVSIVAFIIYIVSSLLSTKIVQTALGVVFGGIILYYLFKYIM